MRVCEYDNEVVLLLGPADPDGRQRWQFRAVRVGLGIEITHDDRFHGWVPHEVTSEWAKALKRLAKRTEDRWQSPLQGSQDGARDA